MSTNTKVYHIDLVVFPTPMYVVFGAHPFLELLQTLGYGGPFIMPYESGIAETHLIDLPNKCSAIIMLMPEIREEEDNEFALDEVGTIVHEAVHAVQYLAESIGEKKFGNETVAYVTEFVTTQAIKAALTAAGLTASAREGDRAAPEQTGKKPRRPKSKVPLEHNRSAGSRRASPTVENFLRRVEDANWQAVPPPGAGVQTV